MLHVNPEKRLKFKKLFEHPFVISYWPDYLHETMFKQKIKQSKKDE
jgi:hypothetical protein